MFEEKELKNKLLFSNLKNKLIENLSSFKSLKAFAKITAIFSTPVIMFELASKIIDLGSYYNSEFIVISGIFLGIGSIAATSTLLAIDFKTTNRLR